MWVIFSQIECVSYLFLLFQEGDEEEGEEEEHRRIRLKIVAAFRRSGDIKVVEMEL